MDPRQGGLAQFARPAAQGLFVDGQHVFGDDQTAAVRVATFSTDGQHLFWLTTERVKQAGPGYIQAVTYVDGKRAVQFDWNEASMVFSIPGGGLADPPPAWNVGADGVLTLVGVIGDQVKRFRITPSADTNISTMIAAAAEADSAKAKADTEAAKPQGRGRRR